MLAPRIRNINSSTLIPLLVLSHATTTFAQLSFDWAFTNLSVGIIESDLTALSQCQQVGIDVYTIGGATPPYSVWAFPVGGTAESLAMGQLTSIGYTIKYAAGTQVSFAVLDSTGKSAGTSYLYNIQSSNNTACLPPNATSNPFTISTNATSLAACQPLGVGFQGGIEPYYLTVSAVDSYSYQNVSLGSGNAGYVYVNDFPLGSRLTVTGQDSTPGSMAATSQIIVSTGTNRTACTEASGPQKVAILPPTTTPVNVPARSSNTAAIVGGTVGSVIAAILIGALVYLYLKKRRRRQDRRISGVSVEPFKDEYASPARSVMSPVPPSAVSSPLAAGGSPRTHQRQSSVMSELHSGSWAAPYFTDFNLLESHPLAPATAYGGGLSSAMIPSGSEQEYRDDAQESRPAFHIMNPDEGQSRLQTDEPPASPRRPLPIIPNAQNLTAAPPDASLALAAKTHALRPRPYSNVLQHTDAGPAGSSNSHQNPVEVPPPYIRRDS